jgi:hypothetical protein
MAHRDPGLVGVIGLSLSYQSTSDTIGRPTDAGIPSIGATLSTDTLADGSRLYYQIAPQNNRVAEVVAQYVTQLRQTGSLPARLLGSRPEHGWLPWDGLLRRAAAARLRRVPELGQELRQPVPVDKPTLVLKVRNGEVVNDASGYCGISRDPRTQPWCPHDPPG